MVFGTSLCNPVMLIIHYFVLMKSQHTDDVFLPFFFLRILRSTSASAILLGLEFVF